MRVIGGVMLPRSPWLVVNVRIAMTIPIIATVMRGLWLMAEWIHSLNHHAESAERDKFSRTIWDVGTCIGVVGVVVGYTDVGRIKTESSLPALGGIVAMLVGLAIRWAAIYTLGRYFTR